MGVPAPLTRDQVAERILAGDNLLILRNKVIKVPHSWLSTHPGGALAILHFVGRDATDEVEAFHSNETLARIAKYAVGTVDCGKDGWESFVPPIMNGWVRRMGSWYNEASPVITPLDAKHSPASQILLVERSETSPTSGPTLETLQPPPTTINPKISAQHSAAYKALHKRIVDAGLYQCRYLTGYGPEIVRYILLATFSAIAYRYQWFITSAICLGLFWHQLTFTAHDLGHVGVTHNWTIDRLLAIFVADFCGGLSIGWWVDVSNTPIQLCSQTLSEYICFFCLQNHNTHHRKHVHILLGKYLLT